MDEEVMGEPSGAFMDVISPASIILPMGSSPDLPFALTNFFREVF